MPAVLPVSKNRRRPLCRNDLIMRNSVSCCAPRNNLTVQAKSEASAEASRPELGRSAALAEANQLVERDRQREVVSIKGISRCRKLKGELTLPSGVLVFLSFSC